MSSELPLGINQENKRQVSAEAAGQATQLGETVLRIILSPTRSGSTALLRCFENNPDVHRVYHQPIKSGFRQDGHFDYSFFDLDQESAGRTLVAKETVGGFAEPETTFSPLPNTGAHEQIGPWLASPSEITRLEPLFLMRDPLQTWASIERLNRYSDGISPYYSPFDFFITSYRNVAEFLLAAKEEGLPVHCVTQEMLGENPEVVMPAICRKWEIPWTESMINWTEPYGVKTWFSEEAKQRMLTDPRFKKSKESLEKSDGYAYRSQPVGNLATPEQVEVIENELGGLYSRATCYAKRDFRD